MSNSAVLLCCFCSFFFFSQDNVAILIFDILYSNDVACGSRNRRRRKSRKIRSPPANLLNAQTIILSLNLLLFMHISLCRFFVLYSIRLLVHNYSVYYIHMYYSLSVFDIFFFNDYYSRKDFVVENCASAQN